VKLLFDENLSPHLVQRLAEPFPDSMHVDDVGLHGRADFEIWNWARDNGFAIASKDDDFRQLSFLNGAPPKVLWLSVGNAGTDSIAVLLGAERARIEAFASDPEDSVLILRLP
jgi:predicted nuclease of predicted toxin-antitoxin system